VGLVFAGDSGVARGTIPVRWHYVSPRVALGWDPFGDGKTALRAAAGVFYGSVGGKMKDVECDLQLRALRARAHVSEHCFVDQCDPYPYLYNPKNAQLFSNSNEEAKREPV
jgi:hypothetical protein